MKHFPLVLLQEGLGGGVTPQPSSGTCLENFRRAFRLAPGRQPGRRCLSRRWELVFLKSSAPVLWVPWPSLRPVTDWPGEFWNTDGGELEPCVP